MPIYQQYANAPKFTSLLAQLEACLSIDPLDYFVNEFDLATADTNGLNNWGRILNQSRTINVINSSSIFGFDTGSTPSPPSTGYAQNFGFGTFFSNSGGSTSDLSDKNYRTLLQFKYTSYIIDNSFKSCVDAINNYVKKINKAYNCKIINDTANLKFIYSFNYPLTPMEITLFRELKILPTPVGVSYAIEWNANPP